ncbi:MAG: small ribosomal subunit Rsm22 family protein [Chloroflexota bacterium]
MPDSLRTAIDVELDKAPSRDLTVAVHALSQHYRTQHRLSEAPNLETRMDVIAYIAYRLPATLAAIGAILDEVRVRLPDFQPRTLLDAGAGPGTAAWAAVDAWPRLHRVTLLERNPRMTEIGRSLALQSGADVLKNADWQQVDIAARWQSEPADLIVAAYAMGEIADTSRAESVRRLWDHTAGTCIIVEPGTPHGFGLVRDAQDELAGLGAHIVAPFPHEWQCLASEHDWCHFSQRVQRTRMHRQVKGATLAYEDEKFSYLVASRRDGEPIAARVLRHPQTRPGHIRLVLCTADGVKEVVVARSNRQAYRRAKDLAWGSAIPLDDAPLYGLPT